MTSLGKSCLDITGHVTAMADSEEENLVGSPEYNGVPNGPRVVIITKTETGFGFNVRGQVSTRP